MPDIEPLGRPLLTELGKVVTTWARIEQNMILHASAMAAYRTNGKPIEYLRMDFKRLREKWFALCKTNFEPRIMDKIVNPLNSKLGPLSKERGHYVHGVWQQLSPERFHLSYWEQKTSLEKIEGELTLSQIRTYVAACERADFEFERFCTGNHRLKDVGASSVKIISTLIPPN